MQLVIVTTKTIADLNNVAVLIVEPEWKNKVYHLHDVLVVVTNMYGFVNWLYFLTCYVNDNTGAVRRCINKLYQEHDKGF